MGKECIEFYEVIIRGHTRLEYIKMYRVHENVLMRAKIDHQFSNGSILTQNR
jgi:hypothetical protein